MKASKLTSLVFALTLLPLTAAAQDDRPVTMAEVQQMIRPGSARPGFYLGLSSGGTSLELGDTVEQRLRDANLSISESGAGGGIFVGYSWSNDFALEFQINGSNMSVSQDNDFETGLAEVLLAVRAPLMPAARVSPYLEGHAGLGVIAFSGSEIEDRAILGGMTGIGGGAEIHLSRHFALDFGYRFSIVNYEQEVIETENGDDEIDFDGSAQTHRIMFRGVYSF